MNTSSPPSTPSVIFTGEQGPDTSTITGISCHGELRDGVCYPVIKVDPNWVKHTPLYIVEKTTSSFGPVRFSCACVHFQLTLMLRRVTSLTRVPTSLPRQTSPSLTRLPTSLPRQTSRTRNYRNQSISCLPRQWRVLKRSLDTRNGEIWWDW